MQQQRDVGAFIREALECSIYLSPTDPGLTPDELLEAGSRFDFLPGELQDAFPVANGRRRGVGGKLLPQVDMRLGTFNFGKRNPEFRNIDAFECVWRELHDLGRLEGRAKARLSRAVLVARARAQGIPELAIEAALTILVMSEGLLEEHGDLRLRYPDAPSPKGQLDQAEARHTAPRNETRDKIYAVVKDIVDRRTDGRPSSAEALDAFAGQLDKLGYGPFRPWWVQTVSELRRLDSSHSPVATCVLAAALVEGALTFMVKHARSLDLGVFASKDFDRDPKSWKIDDLVASAASGSSSAILDGSTRNRTDRLIKTRQRIHAGRMLSEFPAGVPDLRPEEARDAGPTVELVVRSVLDWLEKYPATSPAVSAQ